MLRKLKQWWFLRRIEQSAKATINNHRGFSAKGWDVTPTLAFEPRQQIADAVQTWLHAELPYTATPYGIADYKVTLGYAHMDGAKRTYLGQEPLPRFERKAAIEAIAAIHAHIMAADWTTMPTLTTLEVYLLSYGDVLKPFFDAEAKR
ncbi:hypothetical protein [Herpetosiphon giganteus]|uniref:hypothetical protein n=1 Tax=Herpetosiphon giganteus TaxID=2029754 RepID=UPI0019590376|nr:hypothetical protein [Herpetosiphon giganteus]MBM7844991.1 hypothetical protein [Herpetosiphon giganteus]